jgi:hypothetical protein
MPAVADLELDGSKMAWQDFVSSLHDIKFASERGEVFVRVRPPERCGVEADRVVRDLGLTDCVELLEQGTGIRAGGMKSGARGPWHPSRLAQALTWLLGKSPAGSGFSGGRSRASHCDNTLFDNARPDGAVIETRSGREDRQATLGRSLSPDRARRS